MSNAPASELAVLIATHNRQVPLRRCLESLAAQTQDPNTFEVIVADDGSTDDTVEMVGNLELPFRLRLLQLQKAGKAVAVNAAIQASSSPLCLFTDDDVIASPDLVSEHIAAHRGSSTALGIGALTQAPSIGRDWFARAYVRAWNARYRELAERGADWPDCYGANFSAPRAVVVKVGGFATDLPGVLDIDLGFRLWQAGCDPIYLPDAHAVHEDQKPRHLILQHTFRFGSFCARFAGLHPIARPKLLGWFRDSSPREVILRRLLLALRVPPSALAGVGAVLPGSARQIWFGFVSRYTFWLGVRTSLRRRRWVQITYGVPLNLQCSER